MMMRFGVGVLGFLVAPSLVFGGRLTAQDKEPIARIRAATELSSLNSADVRPWHLKMAVTIFDRDGKNPQNGTAELWRAGADEREVLTFGNTTLTTLKHDGKRFNTTTGENVPFLAEEVVAQVLHPGPDDTDLDGSKPELRKQKFGKVSLDCIMLSRSSLGSEPVPLGLYPTYCLDPKEDTIRSSYNLGSRTVILNRLGTFLGHSVALKVDLLQGAILVGTANVSLLTTYAPEPDEYRPTDEMNSHLADISKISGAVIAGKRLTFVQPVYPEVAKANHESGTVILRAVIGRDGHVHSLRPVTVTNSDFVASAIAAVSQWTYKPYILNGEVTAVDTTITVNYALGPG